jgi:hypothetical protein
MRIALHIKTLCVILLLSTLPVFLQASSMNKNITHSYFANHLADFQKQDQKKQPEKKKDDSNKGGNKEVKQVPKSRKQAKPESVPNRR